MAVTFVLMFISVQMAMATPPVKLNIKMEKANLSQVLKAIEKQSGYSFLFNADEIDVAQPVSLVANDMELDQVLGMITKGRNISYTIKNSKIILESGKPASSATHQQKKVTGTVVDAKGNSIPGVNIIIKGKTTGVASDVDGKFAINASKGDVLAISSIGYKAQDVAVKEGEHLNIILEEDTHKIDEIVVVGFGTQKKANLTGAVAQLNGKALQDRPISNISQAMQGTMPGVTITSGQGRPGQDAGTIRVRGVGTLNNANPYILIDGIESGSMSQLDPNDIESISVLKDAASAAIYGSKASNGVILITTKKGKEGKPVTSYNGYVGWQTPTTMIDRLSSADYATLYNQARIAEGIAAKFTDAEIQKFRDGSDPNYPNTDWYDLAYRTGFQQNHNVSVNGGSESAKYMVSAGYLDQTGILPNSGREQFNGRSNVDIKLSDKLSARMNLAYIKNDYKDANSTYAPGSSDQIIRQLNLIAPWIVNKYADGTYGAIGDGNPIAWLDSGQSVDRYNQNFTGIVGLDYKVLDGLKLSATGSYVGNNQDYVMFVKDIQYNPNKYHGPNSLTEATYTWDRSSFDGLANYDKMFGSHGIKVMLGYHSEKYNYKEKTSYRSNFPNNNLTDMNAGSAGTQQNTGYSRELSMMSYFGRLNYDFKGKYLFEANFRADGSSRFGSDNRWGYFPSLSAGWRISEESFMESLRGSLSNLKLRASWGKLGNQDVLKPDGSPDYYPWQLSYSIGENYPFDGELATGIAQTRYNISTISWEKARTYGFGVDAGLFNKINLSIDYYDRKTTGIIMAVPVPETFGLGSYYDNVGAMQNRGIEFTASYQDKWNDVTFSATGNFSYNKNEFLNLGGVSRMIEGNTIKQVGNAINSYYVYESNGLFQSQEEADAFTAKYGNPFGKKFKAGDLRYVDVNGDGKLNADDRKVANSTDPKYIFGLNLASEWKGFDLSMTFAGAAGVARFYNNELFGEFSGDAQHPSTVWLDAWSTTNKDGKYPRVANARVSASNPYNVASTFWIQNTSYVRLKNVQLGYTIPAQMLKKFGISRFRVYVSGENLFTFDSLDFDVDPEAPAGRGSNYPLIKTTSLGVNLTF
jgi:TonB-linked SusC/RagA family outer membrane protein